MRKSLFRIEMHRGLFGRGMALSLAVGLLLAVSHVIMIVLPMIPTLEANLLYPDKWVTPHTVFVKWMGGESYSLQGYLFYLIAPLLATLPFADSYYTDRKSGYIKNLCTRVPKRRYFLSKFAATFLCGGLAVVLPLMVNLALTAVCLPSHLPQIVTGMYSIDATAVLADLFVTHPYGYIFLYLIFNFAFFGFLAALALDISFFVENRFVVSLTPFLIYLFLFSVMNLTGWQQVNPMIIFNPVQAGYPHSSLSILLGMIAGLGLVTGGIFIGKGTHDDIL